MNSLLQSHISKPLYKYLAKYIDLDSSKTFVVSTTNAFNVTNHSGDVAAIVNLSKVNNIRYINKFFEKVNERLDQEDYFVCCSETMQGRRRRQRVNTIPILRNIYFSLEFLFLRVFPKIWGLKKVYFFITRGRRRILSKAEVLGRLVSCGFTIVDFESHDGLLYSVVKKTGVPEYNMNPSYGPLYCMPRVGKNGKIIGVFKFRTMHPYAEYLQAYLIENHGYADSGKPKDDFRLTPWGRFLRKFWLDEIPQLLNVLKGDLKLVGVRPVSEFYFNELPEDLKQLRKKHKPGCVPPYVALNKSGAVEDVLQAEKQYLLDKEKHPYTTDINYFFRAIYNIIFKGKRSA